METLAGESGAINRVEFFTSEGLHLHYEQAQTRQVRRDGWYNLHFPVRTTDLDGGQNIFRGINQSKLARMKLMLKNYLTPFINEPGRLTLIYGADKVGDALN